MKLTDLFNILSEHDNIDIYRDNVLVSQYDGKNSIDLIIDLCQEGLFKKEEQFLKHKKELSQIIK